MSSAIERSTNQRVVRSNPPHSPAFHHASRKSATRRACPVSLCAIAIRRSRAAFGSVVIVLLLSSNTSRSAIDFFRLEGLFCMVVSSDMDQLSDAAFARVIALAIQNEVDGLC